MIKITDLFLCEILNSSNKEEKNVYNEQELDEISEIYIDKESLYDNDLSEIKYFKNIKKVIFKDIFVNHNLLMNICNLNKLEELHFYNCNINGLNIIGNTNINKLVINNCIFDDLYSLNSLKKLEELYIDNIERIDLKELLIIKNIKKLSLANTFIINKEYLIYMDNIEYLVISGSGIKDISELLYFDKLKHLVIDEIQAKINKDSVMELKNKNIKVVDFLNRDVVMYYE